MPSAFNSAAVRGDRANIRRYGVPAVHEPDAGGSHAYTDPIGVLELPDGNLQDSLSEYTRFFTRPADWETAPLKRDRLTIEGETYIVSGSRPQDEGAVRLILDKTN